MASPPALTTWQRAGRKSKADASPGALVVAAALPLLFLHARYQPSLTLDLGDAQARITLADVAVLAVVGAALGAAARHGFAPLRRGRPVFIAGGAFLVWIGLSLSFPLIRGEPYLWQDRLVSAAKLAEYALLAIAVPLLVREREDARLVARSVIAVALAATLWGLLQVLGAVEAFDAGGQWRRAPSFAGIHDFAALSAAAAVLALLALLGTDLVGRGWAAAAGIAGGIGVVCSGALTAVLGLVLAAAALAALAHREGRLDARRGLRVAGVVVAIAAGTMLVRGSNLADFAAFLGLRDPTNEPAAVESYAQRTLLAYIGLRIFTDHPVTGVGWQGSGETWAFGPHLEAARARFPTEPAEAFPSAEQPWGVQNAPVQILADLGLVGLVLVLAMSLLALRAGVQGGRASPVPALGLAWFLVAAGVWNGLGLVAGIPLVALTSIAVGLAVCDA